MKPEIEKQTDELVKRMAGAHRTRPAVEPGPQWQGDLMMEIRRIGPLAASHSHSGLKPRRIPAKAGTPNAFLPDNGAFGVPPSGGIGHSENSPLAAAQPREELGRLVWQFASMAAVAAILMLAFGLAAGFIPDADLAQMFLSDPSGAMVDEIL